MVSLRGGLALLCAVAASNGFVAGRAHAEETEANHLGVGFKIGNGLGILGADAIVRAVPHVVLDLQANYVSVSSSDGFVTSTATGFGLAPTIQFQLKPIGHTPYVGLGLVYAHLKSGDVTGSATGFLFNVGYEWRFASGVGVLVGGGAADVGEIRATNGTDTVSRAGGWLFNLEAGVRWYFLSSGPPEDSTKYVR
jgi:hypothetical protein